MLYDDLERWQGEVEGRFKREGIYVYVYIHIYIYIYI